MLLGGGTFWLKSVCVAGNKPRAYTYEATISTLTYTLWFSETGPSPGWP